nr:hypothetical protein [Tanacetum cinerariifolium]
MFFRRSIGTRCWDTLVTVCFGISPAKDLVAYVLGKIHYELVSCNINVEQVKLRAFCTNVVEKEALRNQFEQEFERLFGQREATNTNSTNRLNIVSSPVNVVSSSFTTVDPGREKAQRNEFESVFRQDKDANDNRMFTPDTTDTGIFSGVYNDEVEGVEADFNNMELTTLRRTNDMDYQNYILACFISQIEPKKKVWRLVDLPKDKHAIGTKWVYRNKKDDRGIVVRNKARLVVQGYTQEEGIDYDKVFAPVARIEAIKLFFAYASFMGLIVYYMDVKSAFLYGKIEKEVELTFFLGFQVMQKDDGIFISQDKYVADILKNFDFSSVKTASTPIENNKALLKDKEAVDMDVHLYRSMIGSLMYLTASRRDIMFVVCACARFQVTSKVSHLHAVKMIFRYLKGQP